jgi:hypothetical protein
MISGASKTRVSRITSCSLVPPAEAAGVTMACVADLDGDVQYQKPGPRLSRAEAPNATRDAVGTSRKSPFPRDARC